MKKLPQLVKLPPMPRTKRASTGLPRLPKAKAVPKGAADPPIWRPAPEDEVEFADDNFDDRKIGGKDAPGRWYETGRRDGSVGATCWNCGRKRKAENLRLHQRPFGKGEVWICKEGC